MNQSNRFNRFLRHPMVIAIVTAGLFGIIVAWCGAKFQHRNWKVEHEIAKKTTFVDNLFDKRTDLGQKIFYLISKREKNCWNIFHTTKDMFYYYHEAERLRNLGEDYKDIYNKALECRSIITELIAEDREITCQVNSLKQQIKVYYAPKHNSQLLIHYSDADDIWTATIEEVVDNGKIEKKYILDQTKMVNKKIDLLNSLIEKAINDLRA